MPFHLLPWGFQPDPEGHSPRLLSVVELEFEVHATSGWKLHTSLDYLYFGL
jgi:hypothetical protein